MGTLQYSPSDGSRVVEKTVWKQIVLEKEWSFQHNPKQTIICEAQAISKLERVQTRERTKASEAVQAKKSIR